MNFSENLFLLFKLSSKHTNTHCKYLYWWNVEEDDFHFEIISKTCFTWKLDSWYQKTSLLFDQSFLCSQSSDLFESLDVEDSACICYCRRRHMPFKLTLRKEFEKNGLQNRDAFVNCKWQWAMFHKLASNETNENLGKS